MPALLAAFWADDRGAVVSAELVLLVALLILGIIPGLIALRNCENASLATVGNSLLAIQTGFSFAPFTIESPKVAPATPAHPIASVYGASFQVTGGDVSRIIKRWNQQKHFSVSGQSLPVTLVRQQATAFFRTKCLPSYL